jgi:hypothetical protein
MRLTWRRLEVSRRAANLVEAFLNESAESRRCVLVEAALEIGDLVDAHRPLPRWLRRIKAALAPLQWSVVAEQIEQKRKKRDDEEERTDRNEKR